MNPSPLSVDGAATLSRDHFVDTKGFATIASISEVYARQLRCAGGGPPFTRIAAKAVRYRIGDILDWMSAKSVTSTSAMEATH